jgi:hypothetical protein
MTREQAQEAIGDDSLAGSTSPKWNSPRRRGHSQHRLSLPVCKTAVEAGAQPF